MQNQINLDQEFSNVLSNLSNFSHSSKYMLPELFDIFLHLLFIKAIEKLHLDNTRLEDINYSWEKILSSSDIKQYILYNVIPFLIESNDQNIKLYFYGAHRVFEHIDEKTLSSMCQIVDNVKLGEMSNQERYQFVEYLLDSMAEQSGKGGDLLVHRTPKKLRDFMTSILNPQKFESIADLTCGTGALLLSACAHVDNTFQSTDDNTCYGVDINGKMIEISIMHSYISGLKSVHIEQKDIIKDFDIVNTNVRYDKIYGNPPFGVRISPESVSPMFSTYSRNADILFVDAVMMSLKKSGTAAVIVAAGMLSSSSSGHLSIRKKLIDEMNLEAVISLPVMHSHTNVRLILLVFKNETNTNPVLFIDLNSDIDRRRDIELIDKRLEIGVKLYQGYRDSAYDSNFDTSNIELDDLFWFAEKSRIADNEYLLDLNFYKPHKKIVTLPVRTLLEELPKQLSQMVDDIERLKNLTSTIENIDGNSFIKQKLGDVCQMRSGRALPRDEEVENGELPWIQIGDIIKSTEFSITGAETSVSEEFAQIHNLTVVEKNTVLISSRGTLGATVIAGKRMCIGPNVMALNPIDNQMDPWFLFGWFLSEKSAIEAYAQGVVPAITLGMLRNMTIQIPTMIDQEYFTKYYKSMQKLQDIKNLSEDNSKQIGQMSNAIFNQYFQSKE